MRPDALIWHQIVIEVRYPLTFRALDHAGEVADEIIGSMPNWVVTKVNPTEMELGRPAFGLSAQIGISASHVRQVQTIENFDLKDCKGFREDYAGILAPALSIYRVKEFSRIGFRNIFCCKAKDAEEALRMWKNLPFLELKIPESLGAQSKPGSVTVNLDIDQDLKLRFHVENIELEVGVDGMKINWSNKKIHQLPSEKRKDALDARRNAEKRMNMLPEFGLYVDLDWHREDLLNANIEDIKKFVESCDRRRNDVIERMMEGK
jgi:hypothetical protein